MPRRPPSPPLFAVSAFAVLLFAAASARASEFCEVVDTPDGFVALRAAPRADAPLVERMKAGDEVMLLPETAGAWVHVRFWRAGERLKEGGFERFAVGWANGRYLEDCG